MREEFSIKKSKTNRKTNKWVRSLANCQPARRDTDSFSHKIFGMQGRADHWQRGVGRRDDNSLPSVIFSANNNSLVHKSPPIPDRCGLPFINYFKIFKSQPHDRRYASSVRKKKHQLTIRRTGRLIMRVGWGMCKAASKRIKFCKIAWQWLCFQIQTNNSK